jgi:4,5:9,10-diseco-3-hydroxy-5,9,17-trioxoandrosta-1(10),2-diene-4-oate hydrolase
MTLREAVGTEAAASSLVEVDGVQLSVSREGQGIPVVCLHAVAHGAGDYRAFARAVRDGFEVICVDWPGHGRSGTDREPTSAARYAELLVLLLDQLGVERPIVIGNSIGGAAALLYAERRKVRALVLCDSGGLLQVNLLVRWFCAAFTRFFAAGARGASWFGAAYAWYYRRLVLPTAAAAEQRERIIAAGYELAPVLRDAWSSFARPSADLRALAASLQVPVWCAWGKYDRVIPLSRCKPAIERMQHARITVFAAGHSAFLECPEEFAREFTKFASDLSATRASLGELQPKSAFVQRPPPDERSEVHSRRATHRPS